MATISGVWILNKSYTSLGKYLWEDVYFYCTINGTKTLFKGMALYHHLSQLQVAVVTLSSGNLQIGSYGSISSAYDDYRTIDFGGSTTVTSDFYAWFTANATQPPETVADITYNGKTTSLEEGKTATLSCNGKVMASNIVVAFHEAGSVAYNGKTTNVAAGKTATLSCKGKLMASNVVVS